MIISMKSLLCLLVLATTLCLRLRGKAGEDARSRIHHFVTGPPAMVNFYMEEPQNEA